MTGRALHISGISARTVPERGYTIIGVLLIISVLLIVGIAKLHGARAHFDQARSDATINRILYIQNAASNYLISNGPWPGETSASSGFSCRNAITVLASSGDYLKQAGEGAPTNANNASAYSTSLWGANQLRQDDSSHDFHTYCDNHPGATPATYFAVSINTGKTYWARYIANHLPMAMVDFLNGPTDERSSSTVASLVQRAPAIKAYAGKLLREETYATNASNTVAKPDCPSGYSPKIYASFAGMSYSSAAPPIGGHYLTITSQDANSWTIEGRLTTTAGSDYPPGNRVDMLVTTMCEK
jgi:type II secretory pathway pseudopilin PulG